MSNNSDTANDIPNKVFNDLHRNMEHLPIATAILSDSGQTVLRGQQGSNINIWIFTQHRY